MRMNFSLVGTRPGVEFVFLDWAALTSLPFFGGVLYTAVIHLF